MLRFENIHVYNLDEAICASENPVLLRPKEVTDERVKGRLATCKSLVRASKGEVKCHASFRRGILVSFDMIYPNYISPEMQRYHWFEFIQSSSKMYRLKSMIESEDGLFNKYVDDVTIRHMRKLVKDYNKLKPGVADPHERYEAYMRMLSNCPQGIELFVHVTTNYEQLCTMYKQRTGHRLKEDWGAFREMCESLPYFKEFIKGEDDNEEEAKDNRCIQEPSGRCGRVLHTEHKLSWLWKSWRKWNPFHGMQI